MTHPWQAKLGSVTDPLVVFAFEGWSDAGCAATDAVEHLIEVSDAVEIFRIDPEDHYDFQVNRPLAIFSDGRRVVDWPTTSLWSGTLAGRSLLCVRGPEPNLRWRAFTDQLLEIICHVPPRLVVAMGALLADSAHARPIPVLRTTPNEAAAAGFDVPQSFYEGPTGVVGLLADRLGERDLPVVSLWAEVPHYAAAPPSPKASLALLRALADIAGIDVPLQDLPEVATDWEEMVGGLVSTDADLAGYVRDLESDLDEDLPGESGDSLADEVEGFLRRRS